MSKLTKENVNTIFFECLFLNDEIVNGRPTSEYTPISSSAPNIMGDLPTIGFCTNKLNKNKTKILELINMLPKIEEGNAWENLYFNNDGDKWTNDIKDLDQLVMMGMACEFLTYTIVDENITIISKNKGNDNSVIRGINPEALPFQKDIVAKKNKFLEELKTLALSNFHDNYNKVESVIEMLGFKLKEMNSQIEVYDLNNSLLGTMNFNWVFGGTNLEFETGKGILSFITCIDGKSNDGGNISRNIIRLDSLKQINEMQEKKQFTGEFISIEFGMGEITSSNIPRLEVKVIDPHAENIITTFYVSSYSLDAEIDNSFGPYGNYENGTNRKISYDDITKTPYINSNYFMSFESVYNGDGHYIILRPNNSDDIDPKCSTLETINYRGGRGEENEFKTSVRKSQIGSISHQLLTAPRSKNLILYVLDSIDQTIPGIKDYIITNYSLMNEIEKIFASNNNGSGVSPEIMELFNICRVEECDFPSEREEQRKLI